MASVRTESQPTQLVHWGPSFLFFPFLFHNVNAFHPFSVALAAPAFV
jgi:hypothetical protein